MDRLQRLLDAKRAHSSAIMAPVPSGHKCGPITCTKEQWDALTSAGDEEKAARAALISTEQDAINLMHDCYQRLKELGWNDASYCPKDGSEFDAIEAGSTGIHRCFYSGEWPSGHWWIAEAGDLWPSQPILYRVTEAEKARWAEFRKAVRDDITALAAGARSDETTHLAQSEGRQSGPNESEGNAHA